MHRKSKVSPAATVTSRVQPSGARAIVSASIVLPTSLEIGLHGLSLIGTTALNSNCWRCICPRLKRSLGGPWVFQDVTSISPIPGGKADLSTQGAFSTDYLGGNNEYVTASHALRAEIRRAHVRYNQGFYYFLAHDASVPVALQQEVLKWGLAKDEFEDNGNWPQQLFVREARRMIGEYVLTQQDLESQRTKTDVVCMASHPINPHHVQRYVDEHGYVRNEGFVEPGGQKPYQRPYQMIVPKRGEAVNLLVPLCFSASHVAFSSARDEPQYMMLGHAAGVAAKLAILGRTAVQDVSVTELQSILLKQAAVLEYVESPQKSAIDILLRSMKPTSPQRFNWFVGY